jgi:hypothetical protein
MTNSRYTLLIIRSKLLRILRTNAFRTKSGGHFSLVAVEKLCKKSIVQVSYGIRDGSIITLLMR